jgi:hypothetical protein
MCSVEWVDIETGAKIWQGKVYLKVFQIFCGVFSCALSFLFNEKDACGDFF